MNKNRIKNQIIDFINADLRSTDNEETAKEDGFSLFQYWQRNNVYILSIANFTQASGVTKSPFNFNFSFAFDMIFFAKNNINEAQQVEKVSAFYTYSTKEQDLQQIKAAEEFLNIIKSALVEIFPISELTRRT